MPSYGLTGYIPNTEATEQFVSSLVHPTFAHAAPWQAAADKKDRVLYPFLLAELPNYRRGAQGIGSCVGWGWSLAVDLLAAVEIGLYREAESFGGRVLEASIYAFSRVESQGIKRAGRSDGSYGSAAAKAVMRFGTLHYGRAYAIPGDAPIRFDTYSANREKEWGDTGVPDELERFAREHTVKSCTLVTNFEQAAASIASGYPVPVCSGQGFTSRRDEQGFCRASGSWSHCMCFVGVRWDRPGLLCMNSWGASNTGPTWPINMPESIAECSFWVEAKIVDRMLAGRDSFAISGYEGFPPRELPDWGLSEIHR